jgi:hypothetical protein
MWYVICECIISLFWIGEVTRPSDVRTPGAAGLLAANASSTGNQQVATMQLMEFHHHSATGWSLAPSISQVSHPCLASVAKPLRKPGPCERCVEIWLDELLASQYLRLHGALVHPQDKFTIVYNWAERNGNDWAQPKLHTVLLIQPLACSQQHTK